MNSLPEGHATVPDGEKEIRVAATAKQPEADASLTPEEMVQDYLDFLCAPLAGVVPFRERQLLRENALFVIEEQSKGYMAEGFTEIQAIRMSIQRYGQSDEVSESVIECWFRHQHQGRLTRRVGLANVVAMVFCGQAMLWAALLIQWRIYRPDGLPLWSFGLNPAQIRLFLPEPLPLPETGPTLYLLLSWMFAAPFLIGIGVGGLVPVRPARAVWNAQSLFIFVSVLFGIQMLPTSEGLLLALVQVVWWLPVGCLTAQVVAVLNWQRKCRYRVSELVAA